jgi:hypothetical protein
MKKIKQHTVAREKIDTKSEKVLFDFSKLQPVSYIDAKKTSFFIEYLGRLKKLSSLEWSTIFTTQRHGFGTELIPVSSLKLSAQSLVPDDIEKLLVLRATGDNHVFLGKREGNVFQVIFIESQFGDIYSH